MSHRQTRPDVRSLCPCRVIAVGATERAQLNLWSLVFFIKTQVDEELHHNIHIAANGFFEHRDTLRVRPEFFGDAASGRSRPLTRALLRAVAPAQAIEEIKSICGAETLAEAIRRTHPHMQNVARSHSSSSSQEETPAELRVRLLTHAFHCRDSNCESEKCFETKTDVVAKINNHIKDCNSYLGKSTAKCKVCELYLQLHLPRFCTVDHARFDALSAAKVQMEDWRTLPSEARSLVVLRDGDSTFVACSNMKPCIVTGATARGQQPKLAAVLRLSAADRDSREKYDVWSRLRQSCYLRMDWSTNRPVSSLQKTDFYI